MAPTVLQPHRCYYFRDLSGRMVRGIKETCIPFPGRKHLTLYAQRSELPCQGSCNQVQVESEEHNVVSGSGRRDTMVQMAMSAFLHLSVVVSPATAVEEDFEVYSDDVNKFDISIPKGWLVGTGNNDGIKSVTAFYPQEAGATSNVSVLITGLGPDFTRLESFGKIDAFAENLVSGLDRSWQKPPGVAAKLIGCKAAKGLYYIEYTLRNPGESRRHIYSALGMANNGWYNRLYTVTGQFLEEESAKHRIEIEKAVESFRLVN